MNTTRKQTPLKSIIRLITIVIIFALVHTQCTRSVATEQGAAKKEEIPVKIASESIQNLAQNIEVTGLVIASKQQRLSFKTGGIIDKIFVSEGQSVKKGQLLASLKLNEIEEQVRQANLGFEKASRDYERVQNLFADSICTLEQMQNANTGLEIAKSNLDIAQYNLRFSKIEAPSNGNIFMKLNESNELVGAGMPIIVLASNEEEWQVKVGITDKEVVRVTLADRAKVKLDAYPNLTFPAFVSQIGDAPDPMTGLYEIRLTFSSFSKPLKPGFFAKAELIPSEKRAYLTIPINAVSEGIGNTVSYFVLSADKTKALKKVAVVEWIQDDQVVLGSTLETVEAIIIESPKQLTHLSSVKVIEN